MEIERRITESEVRVLADGQPRIVGHAAVFNRLSEDLGGFREIIAPGAFDSVLADDVRALVNHDPNLILGRTKAGTLRLSVDDEGLAYEITPPDTTVARDLLANLTAGNITQSSFAFWIAPEGEAWGRDKEGGYIRTITRMARLFDVSPVTYPAYPDTDVAKRHLAMLHGAAPTLPDDLEWIKVQQRHAITLGLIAKCFPRGM